MEKETHQRNRELIGRGIEHNVYKARLGKSAVLKISRFFNRLSLGINPAPVIRQEREKAQALISNTDVRIPRTLIISFDAKVLGVPVKRYVMGQQYIQDDGSVMDIGRHLAGQGLDTLVDEYVHEPRNFKSHKGVVYWVDPTKGTIGRVLETTGVTSLQRYRKIRRKLSKVIRFFGL